MKRTRQTIRWSLLAVAATVAALALAAPAGAHHGDHHDFGGGTAGTIASFDPGSGVLVIDLADGGSVSGLVTRFTWIESDENCDGGPSARHHDSWCRRHHGEPGDDHDGHHGPSGSTADLVAGAGVDDALLVLKDGRAFFAKVDLGG
ncbi:MAG TPA: hypothetical protein VHU86_06075 [Solirubrobacterales bacterium]|jgi:hypothetical protein|nr:hypothetical protein [Solirubrobacterales bacterium]